MFLNYRDSIQILLSPSPNEKHVTTRAMRYGYLHAHAKNAYMQYLIHEHHKDATITRTRLHIDPSHNWIGTSLDGLVYDPSSKNDPRGYWKFNVQPVLSLYCLKICVVDHTFFLKMLMENSD